MTFTAFAQSTNTGTNFTHQDTLRGSNGEGRKHWNVLHYDITVIPDMVNRTIQGKNTITFIESAVDIIQIDLQEPMIIDSVKAEKKSCSFQREENVYWVDIKNSKKQILSIHTITIYFHGHPKAAVNPPWDGGWIWSTDKLDNPWISVACQGLGASCWFPCKDIQSDEPDNGAILHVVVPDSLTAVSNGRMKNNIKLNNGTATYSWEVKNPINNYNIVPYIGKYKHYSEIYKGLKGKLSMDYWVLEVNMNKAKLHFRDAIKMMKAFEYWFGPYPFYEDGYKLVEAPFLGMEHQSAIAYGNKFQKGYLGTDLSNTGFGLLWDFIIVHESGHEWFGNNITSKDIADMWIHESFTNYSETLFTEYYYGKSAAEAYIKGLRKRIRNDRPIIGDYGVNQEGSSDMYDKGGNMIHTIRQIIDDDKKFRKILVGLNKQFYHQTVNTQQIEDYFSKHSGINCSFIFNQYLRTKDIPILNYYFEGNKLKFKWENCISNFKMPIKISVNGRKEQWILPEQSHYKSIAIRKKKINQLKINDNFYVKELKLNNRMPIQESHQK